MEHDTTKAAIAYHAIARALMGDYVKITKVKRRFGDWETAWRSIVGTNGLFGAAKNGNGAEQEWEKVERAGMDLVLFEDEDYPAPLRQIADPPYGLYVLRTLSNESGGVDGTNGAAPTIAIVGTRRATPEGKTIAKRFARELARYGCSIVSGLAFGIDAAAHEGCLEAQGKTMAVLAGGLDDIYPHSNRRLAERILQNGGAVISEYPPSEPPYGYRFLERNRIISGLARGALIVEAPTGSGALTTARRALDQNRDVFVVPGTITHPNFAGSHELIRQGAELVTAPEDILAAWNISPEEKISAEEKRATPEEKQVLEVLRREPQPADIDKIITMTKLEPRIANRAVSFLLIRNVIKEKGGGYTI
jgi:DNA processing protein